MRKFTHLLVLLIFLFGTTWSEDKVLVSKTFPTTTEEYLHGLPLDETENYFLYWKFDENSIVFEVHARTKGWVGFGLSSGGGMRKADIVIGWVKDGKGHMKDRYGIGNQMPLVDPSQDYTLLLAQETEDFTTLKFKRVLRNCDENDYNIEAGTVRLIYAWGESDPEGHESVSYHGSTRGIRSLVLLDRSNKPNKEKLKAMENDKDYKTFDMRPNNVTVGTNRTTYWCRVIELPKLSKKHHVIKVESDIQKENLGVVHHIVIYMCHGTLKEEKAGRVCWEGSMPDNATKCDTVMFGWAVGQEDFYYPDEAGFPIGGPDDPLFIQMEMHYDNPQHLKGVVDNSGLKITYTPNLRKHDVGTLVFGSTVGFPKLVVPPDEEDFTLDTYCSGQCTKMTLPPTGIHIFGSLLHTHLLGKKILVRQIRNGKELPELFREDYYDFNYQQTQMLPKPRHLLPGDDVITTCTYNSKKRKVITKGGPGTDNEMCISFMVYYPRVPLAACVSAIQDPMNIHQFVIEKAMKGEINIGDVKNDDYDAYKYLDKLKWTKELHEEFYSKTIRQTQGFRQFCTTTGKGKGALGSSTYRFLPKIEIKEPLVKRDMCKKQEISAAESARGIFCGVILAAVMTVTLLMN